MRKEKRIKPQKKLQGTSAELRYRRQRLEKIWEDHPGSQFVRLTWEAKLDVFWEGLGVQPHNLPTGCSRKILS